ncbi:PadR family transcriptional regulator [Leucobacter sp. wl10]|uniref:PadR family transcriptional regulator n=1 Tax=Leucobacter sp. wl10 TaxID=2304677 RepID=UPI000E5C28AA|nr:PadR family transcriptional regulator [Leucobacter sp. wl10]RGE21863.1 PadR family transcriptional regulator [Leucobacter sp. wl10]
MQVKQEGGGEQSSEWPSDWMRAILGVLTLRALEPGPSYGYAIIADLESHGMGAVKGGTLYPLLTRYESAGLVAVEWRPGEAGPGRKYFSLTDLGRSELERVRAEWSRFTSTSTEYLSSTTPVRTDTP